MNEFDYSNPLEARFNDEFLENGYVVLPVEDEKGLERIQKTVVDLAAKYFKIKSVENKLEFLNSINNKVDISDLNNFRMAIINGIRQETWFHPTYFNLAKTALERIVGNELAMQRGVGLNIQLPGDKSSLLPVHTDVWGGDSPYEVVVWLPLVDCYRTKSMYLMSLNKDRQFQKNLAKFKNATAEDIFESIRDDVAFIDVPFGKVLLFSQTLMHGNRINNESETRWSFNCRFKSLLSPYSEKKLGEFFDPIVIKPATRLGMSYKMPVGLDD